MSRKKRFKALGKKQVLGCDFYTTASGGQPVRTWLKLLRQHDEETVAIIGADIEAIQWRWPVGLPLVEKLGGKLFAVRSSSSSGEWRVFFTVMGDLMVLLHGVNKKSKKTLPRDIALARERLKEVIE